MTKESLNITPELAGQLIANQFPEYAHLPIVPVQAQGHDNYTFRLGQQLLMRMPSAAVYALKVPIEQAVLPCLRPFISVAIPEPVKMGEPCLDYPFHFSIYKWLDGCSLNTLNMNHTTLNVLALELANFLKQLQAIQGVKLLEPGQHNWWRGAHVSVYDDQFRQQVAALAGVIDTANAMVLWESACQTQWHKPAVWIHGDFASGNLLLQAGHLAGVIDFGGVAVGDPACDLVIAWTLLDESARAIFIHAMALDENTWLRAKAWALWKATFELSQMLNHQQHAALVQKNIIRQLLS